jgi:SPOR domain
MTDIRAGDAPLDDDDKLPWLEAVDEDEDRDGPSPLKLIAAVLIGLIAIGLVVGGLFWMGNRDGQAPETELIAAEEGDYKVAPSDPGGMKVEGKGDTAFAASEGAETKGAINVNAMPEAPVTKAAPPAAAPAPKQVATAPKAAPAPAVKATAPAAGGATIQLGAFDSNAAANGVWQRMSGRFGYLKPLNHSVMTAKVGGKTYYRLRATGPGAADICRRLTVAGEACMVVR